MADAKYAVQAKSLRKNYVRFSLDFRPEELEALRAACARNGTTPTGVIKAAVREYIAAHGAD